MPRNVRRRTTEASGANGITHRQLVERGASWLKSTKHSVVCAECVTRSHEVPDVIGWKANRSTLLECKISMADFKKDQEKIGRQLLTKRLGQVRYYLTPPGLLTKDDLPAGWGLLELHGLSVKEIVPATKSKLIPIVSANELTMTLSLLRRAELRGVKLTETLSERILAEKKGRVNETIILGDTDARK